MRANACPRRVIVDARWNLILNAIGFSGSIRKMATAHYLKIALILLIVSGGIYNLLSLFCVIRFSGRKGRIAKGQPNIPVSVLKPVRGIEPDFRRNIESFCRQDYPEYEVLLGFTDTDDSAIPAAREIAASFRHVKIVITREDLGANKKVTNLQGLLDAAKYPLIVMSDSDMRVRQNYLRTIVNEYQRPGNIGMVTSLYYIPDPPSVGAALESLTLASDFIPAVLVAQQLEGITFGLGASMLMSKQAVEAMGALPAVADHLADDYQIGNRLWKKGYTIVLSDYVIEDVVGAMSVSSYLTHQMRWARTYRASRPWGYFGYGVTHILPFGLFLLITQGPRADVLAILGTVLCIRVGLTFAVHTGIAGSKKWLKWLPLLPLKDILSFFIWISSFTGRKVLWRGRYYRLLKGGRMEGIDSGGS
jgi:ceramide glucosyltransferase